MILAFSQGIIRYIHRDHLYLIITVLLIFIIHLPKVRDISSNIIYTLMWLINISLSIAVYNLSNKEFVVSSLRYLGYIFILLLPFSFLAGSHPQIFFGSIGLNLNLISFFIAFAVFTSVNIQYKSPSILLMALSLATQSRMQLLMYTTYFFLKSKFLRICTYIGFAVMAFFLFPQLSIVSDFIQYLFSGQFQFSEDFNDTRRIYLLIAALETIKNNFPLGTGFGLENYKEFASLYISNAYAGNVRLSMTHNFYVSYLALSGIFFLPLLILVLKPAFVCKNRFSIIYILFLVGIAFNEYITSPLFWALHGLTLTKEDV